VGGEIAINGQGPAEGLVGLGEAAPSSAFASKKISGICEIPHIRAAEIQPYISSTTPGVVLRRLP
jgi:hypothetical protein